MTAEILQFPSRANIRPPDVGHYTHPKARTFLDHRIKHATDVELAQMLAGAAQTRANVDYEAEVVQAELVRRGLLP